MEETSHTLDPLKPYKPKGKADYDYGFMQALYDTALSADLPIISTDTAAQILAVVYVHGNNEFMCHSPKFAIEIKYIQQRFGLKGSLIPDTDLVKSMKTYIEQLELFEKRNPEERYPEWAKRLFMRRYGFKLIN